MGFFNWFSRKKSTPPLLPPPAIIAPIDAENLFKDAAQEVEQEKDEKYIELLHDENLRSYLKTCFKSIVKKSLREDAFCISLWT